MTKARRRHLFISLDAETGDLAGQVCRGGHEVRKFEGEWPITGHTGVMPGVIGMRLSAGEQS